MAFNLFDKMPNIKQLQRIVLDKLAVSFSPVPISPEFIRNAELREYTNYLTAELHVQLRSFVAAKTTTRKDTHTRVTTQITIPLTWWDHLKIEHAPRWFAQRWPAQTRTVDIVTVEEIIVTTQNICPHIELPNKDIKHFEFFMRVEEPT